MLRLFTALKIPVTIGQSLALLRGGLPGARWIDPDNYHITLRFIGDIDDALAREIAFGLGQVRRAGFELRLDGLAVFGGRRPRALVATAPAEHALADLQAEQERLMQRLGLAPEGRNYLPHVTLARLRDTPARAVADFLATRQPFRTSAFAVSRFVLMSSRTSTGGGPYVVEAGYPLGPGGGGQDGKAFNEDGR